MNAKTAIVYGSLTRSGNTFAAAERLRKTLPEADLVHVEDFADPSGYSVLVLLTPTAGNEELAEPFERFFDREDVDLSHARYALCELGNYYGYDLFEYGAAKILRRLVEARGGKEFFPTLSLDTLPLTDWDLFDHWTAALRVRIEAL